MKSSNNKATAMNEADLIVKGLKKYFSKNKQTLSLNGVTYTSAELVKKFEQCSAQIEETNLLHAKFTRAVAQERNERQATRPIVLLLRSFVANLFGDSSEAFLEFGFKPRKVGKRTVASKARAISKEAATRASHNGAPAPVVTGASNGAAHS